METKKNRSVPAKKTETKNVKNKINKNGITMKEFKSEIKKRMLHYMSVMNISQYVLYANTGISRGILSQDNRLSEENLTKFLSYYEDVSCEWLIRGKGEMLLKPATGIIPTVLLPHPFSTVAEDGEIYGMHQCIYYQVCSEVSALLKKINIMEEDIKQLKKELKN